MAEEDDSNKTEDPTQRKLDDAHGKGNVVRSQEVSNWVMIAASTLVVAMFAGSVMKTMTTEMIAFLESPHTIPIDGVAAARLLKHVGLDIVRWIAAPVGILFLAAVAAAALQHKPVMAWSKLSPNFGHLSPIKGLKQKFSMHTTVDLFKNLLKLGVIGGVVEWLFAFPNRLSVTISNGDRLVDAPREQLAQEIWDEICRLTGIKANMPPWQIVRERRATFAATPAQNALRPGTVTPWKNLFLAGDWTDTGLPATIEGAVRSGFTAAGEILRLHAAKAA